MKHILLPVTLNGPCRSGMLLFRWLLGLASLLAAATLSTQRLHAIEPQESDALSIEINATRLPRKLLESHQTIPVEMLHASDHGKLALWYPKWVPGAHAPAGPVANVAGIIVTDQNQRRLKWQRSAGEVYRIEVTLREDTTLLHVYLRYITNQPTTGSFGCDSFGSELLGVISPNTVLMCPEGMDIDETRITAQLTLPDHWQVGSALPIAVRSDSSEKPAETDAANIVRFHPVSLRTFVDSPVLCGRYSKVYDLVEPDRQHQIPPHRLHVFSEAESVLKVDEQLLARLRQMVTQTALLMDSHPFETFEILLATTDVLPANGLEHARSSFNVLGQRTLQSVDKLKGWNRLLLPHEYLHAWCGKYRIPRGMLQQDFSTPLDTDLLWVYEGLTQYLGELMEARSGLMSEDEFRNRLAIEVRHAMYQQGRHWRSLADTASASYLLRDGSVAWPRLRRSQDYYMEGMLFWLEADSIIRGRTDHARSLDDFCRAFFHCDQPTALPRGFSREEIVSTLKDIVDFDWDKFVQRRIEMTSLKFQPEVVERLGWTVQYSNQPAAIPDSTYRAFSDVDAYDSLGCSIAADGVVRDILLDSAADQAGLGPGMKIVAVNDHAWSVARMHDALAMSVTRGQMELLVVNGDSFSPYVIKYDGGPRYLVLQRQEGMPDLLPQILQPRE